MDYEQKLPLRYPCLQADPLLQFFSVHVTLERCPYDSCNFMHILSFVSFVSFLCQVCVSPALPQSVIVQYIYQPQPLCLLVPSL